LIDSGWQKFKYLSMVQTVCHWGVAFVRQQTVQARRLTQLNRHTTRKPCYRKDDLAMRPLYEYPRYLFI